MRQRSVNYFWGTVFSSQFILAYGIAGAFTTALQLLLVWRNAISLDPGRLESLSAVVDLYIETILPVWIGGITWANMVMILLNVIGAFLLILSWTVSYDNSF